MINSSKCRQWSEDDIQFLINNHRKGIKYLLSKLDRSRAAIDNRLQKLGLLAATYEAPDPDAWSAPEIAFLKANANLTNTELSQTLNRTEAEIAAKRFIAGLLTGGSHACR